MNFLSPLFLLGAAAVAGPIIFHLIRRTTRERMPFSSLMFLAPTPPRLTKKSRIEHWLLLLLRSLALGLMAFGFARPFFKDPPASLDNSGPRRRMVILLDTSASMRRADCWSEAKQKLDTVVRGATAADELALVTFARSTEILISFEDWQRAPVGERTALVRSRLSGLEPGWRGTHLGSALIRAGDLLAEASNNEAPGIRRIVLISDLQTGSHLEALQSYEWPKEIELVVESVSAKTVGNAHLQWLSDAGEVETPGTNVVRIRVSNAGDSVKEKFQLSWATGTAGMSFGAPVEVYVPPGQSRTVTMAVATNAAADRVRLVGDGQEFDNLLHVVPPEVVRTRVLYLGGESVEDTKQAAFFLRQALPATRRQVVDLQVKAPTAGVSAAELDAAPLYIVRESLPDALVTALRERVQAGKLLFVVLKNPGMAATAAKLLGLETLPVVEAKLRDYAMLENIEFRHPAFAPFADPRYSDFTRIHFWKYRQVSPSAIPGARVVAGFDSGDPALLEVGAGRGKILLLTTGWQPEESQWALSTKFVPFIFSLLEMAGGTASGVGQMVVGEMTPVPAGFGLGAELVLEGPEGSPLKLGLGATNLPVIEVPGLHVLRAGPETFRFAANLDPLESRTLPMSMDELERWGAPIRSVVTEVTAAEKAKNQAKLQSQEAEGRQKLWRWFVAATLLVVLGETMLAGWTSRQLTAGAPA